MKTLKFLTIITVIVVSASCTNHSSKTNLKESKVKLIFKVGGMTCTDCEKTIKNNITILSGIDSVKASYLDSTTIVYCDSSKSGVKSISQAIESKGYKVNSMKILD